MSYKMMCALNEARYVFHDLSRGVLWAWYGGTRWYAYNVEGEEVDVRTMPECELRQPGFEPSVWYDLHIARS
jgi:hypothetical protein